MKLKKKYANRLKIIVLVIIIILHLKEVKEEQKETNKFKSWFA